MQLQTTPNHPNQMLILQENHITLISCFFILSVGQIKWGFSGAKFRMTIHRYDYRITINDNQYKIQIDKNFSDITDLEDISRYGHAERRAFAEHIIFKFGVSSPCILDSSDCINPFATELSKLFNGQMTCSFIVRDRVTTLCISGSLNL